MTNEDMWNELTALRDSWDKRGGEATKAFMLLTAMVCQFAIINNIPLNILQDVVKRLYTKAYTNLKDLLNLKDLVNFKPE